MEKTSLDANRIRKTIDPFLLIFLLVSEVLEKVLPSQLFFKSAFPQSTSEQRDGHCFVRLGFTATSDIVVEEDMKEGSCATGCRE
jgi:hypothetical protein